MGGFTEIILKDVSEENIKIQNEILKNLKVPKKYRFYSIDDIILEYECFKNGNGAFPEHLFPKNKIKSFKDFQKFWNPKQCGLIPKIGGLTFDCYFNRTGKMALRKIGKYVFQNIDCIDKISGSVKTFMERGMTKHEQEFMLHNQKQ